MNSSRRKQIEKTLRTTISQTTLGYLSKQLKLYKFSVKVILDKIILAVISLSEL